MNKVYLATPTHNGQMDSGAAMCLFALACAPGQERIVIPRTRGRSLLNSNCNGFWCEALNWRAEHGIKWFAMLHSDIEPEPFWLDKLIDEAEKHDADMLSVCVPIKDQRGLTSTAFASDEEDYRVFARLTQRQIWHDSFPDTFDLESAAEAVEQMPGELRMTDVPRVGLRLNTGCMVCRIDRDWAMNVWFDSLDGIEFRDGLWQQWDVSEDWRFSRRVQDQGGKLMGTRAVKVTHKGVGLFPNDKPWGSNFSDMDCLPKEAVA